MSWGEARLSHIFAIDSAVVKAQKLLSSYRIFLTHAMHKNRQINMLEVLKENLNGSIFYLLNIYSNTPRL